MFAHTRIDAHKTSMVSKECDKCMDRSIHGWMQTLAIRWFDTYAHVLSSHGLKILECNLNRCIYACIHPCTFVVQKHGSYVCLNVCLSTFQSVIICICPYMLQCDLLLLCPGTTAAFKS